VLARACIATLLVMGYGAHYQRAIVGPLLPLLQNSLVVTGDEYRVRSLDIDDGDNDSLRLRADLARTLYIGDHYVSPLGDQGWLQVNLTLGGALAYSELLLILLLAWPVADPRELAWRALIGLPLIVVLLLINIDTTLSAELWTAVHRELEPGALSALLTGSRFLMGGGGWAIALLLAAATIALSTVSARR
jgi:hypothetical protein